MDHIRYLQGDTPALRRPVVIAAFEGWNDAGDAASTAVGFVATALRSKLFARIDPEEFYDFQETRPMVRLVDGSVRRIEWPSVDIEIARSRTADRDLVLVRGSEPNLRWRTFSEQVLEITRRVGAELFVTVGALLADVPHTRPVQVVGSASDPDLAAELSLATSRYEGPTGILGVLGDAAASAGVPVVNLWAALPHYVQATPNPRAALALVEKLSALLGFHVNTRRLAEATDSYDRTVAELVSEDPELVGYIERLEREADDEADDDEVAENVLEDLPPEEFVAEVERFLRDQPGGPRQ